MESSSSCRIPYEPTPCIAEPVGDCPEIILPDDSDSGVTSESSICPYPGPYRAIRDWPRQWYGQDVANFTMGAVIQYFWVPSYRSPILQHSHLAFTWDPVGHFKYVELDDNKIPRHILWDKDKPKEQREASSSGDTSSSGSTSPVCYYHESTAVEESEVSELRQKANCVVRVMAIRGSYGCMNPCAGSSVAPDASSLCDSDKSSAGQPSVKVFFPQEEWLCQEENAISAVDPTLTNTMSELAMEIDPAGHLFRVYWGGRFECDDNPCVWDREHPPAGMANVVVPVIQQSFRFGFEDEGSFDIWLLHFDPLGHYMYASAYMRICQCFPTCSHRFCESSEKPFHCECRDLCLITEGCEGLASSPATCPATVSIDCELAVNTDCVSAISVPGNCVYTWTLQCCPVPVTDSSLVVSSAADASDVTNQGCFYTSWLLNCEIRRPEESEGS